MSELQLDAIKHSWHLARHAASDKCPAVPARGMLWLAQKTAVMKCTRWCCFSERLYWVGFAAKSRAEGWIGSVSD